MQDLNGWGHEMLAMRSHRSKKATPYFCLVSEYAHLVVGHRWVVEDCLGGSLGEHC